MHFLQTCLLGSRRLVARPRLLSGFLPSEVPSWQQASAGQARSCSVAGGLGSASLASSSDPEESWAPLGCPLAVVGAVGCGGEGSGLRGPGAAGRLGWSQLGSGGRGCGMPACPRCGRTRLCDPEDVIGMRKLGALCLSHVGTAARFAVGMVLLCGCSHVPGFVGVTLEPVPQACGGFHYRKLPGMFKGLNICSLQQRAGVRAPDRGC